MAVQTRLKADDYPRYELFLRQLTPSLRRPISFMSVRAYDEADFVMVKLRQLSLKDRADIVISMDPLLESDLDEVGRNEREELRTLFDACLSAGLPTSAEVVDLVIEATSIPENEFSSLYRLSRIFAFLEQAKLNGHTFTLKQGKSLGCLARALENADKKYYTKDEERRVLALARKFDALANTSPSEAEKFAGLCAQQPSPNRFRPLPPNIEFWCSFLDQVSDKAQAIADELDAGDPDWMCDESAFHARFREVVDVPVEFEFWKRRELVFGERDDWRNFAIFRRRFYPRPEPLLPKLPFEKLQRAMRELQPLANHEWDRNWLPGADILLGSQTETEKEFLLHLTGGGEGPKPNAKWLNKANVLIETIGKNTSSESCRRWLAIFSSPCVTQEKIAELTACHWRLWKAAIFQEECPGWVMLDDASLSALAEWVALCAIGFWTPYNTGEMAFFHWLNVNRGIPEIQKKIGYPDGEILRTHERRIPFVFPTIRNEAVLRAVVWLMGDDIAPDAVKLLEDTVLAATRLKDSDRYRSRSVANAAIASLGRIGTKEALHTLGRIRRTVKDKAIGNSVQKAMAQLAEKLSMDVDDVAEMSLPDYDLA